MFRFERLLDGKGPILRVLIWGKLIFRARELAEFGDSLLQLLEGLVVCEEYCEKHSVGNGGETCCSRRRRVSDALVHHVLEDCAFVHA